jgi:hypothetical protein
MSTNDCDDDLTLSSSTAAALAEFLAEKQQAETSLSTPTEISIDAFPEDWQVPPPTTPLTSSYPNSGTTMPPPKH